ncbi:hypothetical protein A5320_10965 [Rheinheimera sp. SA_1]|uniref:hypothetical protein n=1 Tax=Rheinheimera sp. SA_1 TaxID=1827365 RepID=UPI0007FD29B8|nr:hypothetical protein [Rheinheimera sp. SA_1]OBP14303.1 hypothetical protein A5320_10965 [Rheinheimera sp. SA_1]
MLNWLNLRHQQLVATLLLAASSFLLAYLLLQLAPAGQYGIFAFMLVLQAFGMALQNALVAAPLLILMNTPGSAHVADATAANTGTESKLVLPAALKGFLLLALLINSLIALLQAGYLWHVTEDCWLSLSLAVASWLQLLRWYGRSEWQNREVRVLLRSDLFLSLLVFFAAALLWWFERVTLQNVGWLLLMASVVALQPFVAGFRNVLRTTADWRAVQQGFTQQGKPALFGVLTVEATANFHCYLVIALSGSNAFAPLAAAMLFFRPLTVVLSSLQQSERPLLVKALAAKNYAGIQQLANILRRTAIGAFLLNLLVLLVIFHWAPVWLWPDTSGNTDFRDALFLWSLIALLRALRAPLTALLQAANQFAPLARVTYASAILTVPAVLVSWWLAGPVASLIGVLAGELMLGWLLLRLQQQLRTAELQ